MNYAVPTNAVMVTTKRIATKKILSDETRKRKEFFASHRIIIDIDPMTKEPKVEVFERNECVK